MLGQLSSRQNERPGVSFAVRIPHLVVDDVPQGIPLRRAALGSPPADLGTNSALQRPRDQVEVGREVSMVGVSSIAKALKNQGVWRQKAGSRSSSDELVRGQNSSPTRREGQGFESP